MKFESFNKKYRNGKKDNVWESCRDALLIMKNSKDTSHDLKHVENIFSNINLVINDLNNIKINFDVLVLAVCWHDVWKASYKYKGLWNLLYRQVVEGISAANLFKKRVKRYKLSDNINKNVYYAIRKHSQLQFLPIITVEAKLLDDADKIDAVNYKRLQNTELEKIMLKKSLYIKFVIWYFDRHTFKLNYSENISIYDNYRRDFINYLQSKLKDISFKSYNI